MKTLREYLIDSVNPSPDDDGDLYVNYCNPDDYLIIFNNEEDYLTPTKGYRNCGKVKNVIIYPSQEYLDTFKITAADEIAIRADRVIEYVNIF